MTTPSGDHCRFRSRGRAHEGPPGSFPDDHSRRVTAAPIDDLYGFEDRNRGGRRAFERTWLLLEAADRTEALAAGARAEADRAADAARAYLVLADRLRSLASSAPDRDWADDELGVLADGVERPAL